jgi:TonB family protein
MDNLFVNLLKMTAGTTLLYLCYLLFFRKDTFYLRNRIYLILTLVLPTFIPFIIIPVYKISEVPAFQSNASDYTILSGSRSGTLMTHTVNSFDYNRLIMWIYILVVIFLVLRIAFSLITTYRIIKKGIIKKSSFPKIIVTGNLLPPFSFFPFAVIPVNDYESGNYAEILDHEFAHLRQGHTFDLLLSEFFIAFQWFNPVIWLIKRSVILNHEYLADHLSVSNKCIKEYQYRLLNFQPGLKNISLAHNFNSQIKNRIIMINKKPSHRYATLKNILILPVVSILIYAFATPEYHKVKEVAGASTINQIQGITQKEVKGIVYNEAGKPLEGVNISCTGIQGDARMASTGSDGRFSIDNVQSDASLLFFYRGYKQLVLKPDFVKEMNVKMEIDPAYKAQAGSNLQNEKRNDPIVVVDGVISEKTFMVATKDLGYNMGINKYITAKEATGKYGDKGVNGAYEIITRKKALEMGLKPPFPRLAPGDYPTFQGMKASRFSEWVVSHIKYPAEARLNNLEGWVALNFNVELNGTISNIVSTIPVDRILSDEVTRVVQSSPKWDSPKNPKVDEPFTSNVILRFKLPDQVFGDAPYVMVEEMPAYPGGDIELLNSIKNNVRYPETAKKAKIEGRVIVRFIVSSDGKAEGVSVLKGVDPQLDAEAIRVIYKLADFKPGRQGGKPVNVWYMAPVNFSLSEPEPALSKNSELEILKFIGMGTGYPQEARSLADTGSIFVVVKLVKGGIIKECKAYTEKADTKVSLLPEVVIVGYKPSEGQDKKTTLNSAEKEHISLKTECLRIANLLSVNEIPEWKDKNLEFALAIRFVLK